MEKSSTHYIATLVRHARRLGLPIDRILTEVGIPPELSDVEHELIDNALVTALMKALWQATDDETIGIDAAHTRPGTWALACDFMLAAENLGDLFRRGERILAFLPPESLGVDVEFEADFVSVELKAYVGERDPDHFMMEFWGVVWHRFPSWAIDENIQLQRISFTYPEPPHSRIYDELFQCDVAFGQSTNGFSFSKKYLPKLLTRNKTELDAWLRNSPADMMYLPGRETSVQARIKLELKSELQGSMRFPAFETVCERLYMSPQVVRRRLTEEGTSYQKIKDSIRRDLAFELIVSPELTFSDIAERIGFTEPAAFSRAFKKWTGQSPADYRNRKIAGR